jgi:hypothetical protein
MKNNKPQGAGITKMRMGFGFLWFVCALWLEASLGIEGKPQVFQSSAAKRIKNGAKNRFLRSI